jgi:hypothetical protein
LASKSTEGNPADASRALAAKLVVVDNGDGRCAALLHRTRASGSRRVVGAATGASPATPLPLVCAKRMAGSLIRVLSDSLLQRPAGTISRLIVTTLAHAEATLAASSSFGPGGPSVAVLLYEDFFDASQSRRSDMNTWCIDDVYLFREGGVSEGWPAAGE